MKAKVPFIQDGGIIIEVFLRKPNNVAIKLKAREITNAFGRNLLYVVLPDLNSLVSNKSYVILFGKSFHVYTSCLFS